MRHCLSCLRQVSLHAAYFEERAGSGTLAVLASPPVLQDLDVSWSSARDVRPLRHATKLTRLLLSNFYSPELYLVSIIFLIALGPASYLEANYCLLGEISGIRQPIGDAFTRLVAGATEGDRIKIRKSLGSRVASKLLNNTRLSASFGVNSR